jgi:hypothetical protein
MCIAAMYTCTFLAEVERKDRQWAQLHEFKKGPSDSPICTDVITNIIQEGKNRMTKEQTDYRLLGSSDIFTRPELLGNTSEETS